MFADTTVGADALLEREAAGSLVDEVLQRALNGQGATVKLEGPAGIGKSAMIAAVRADAARRGTVVISARSGELERDFPFAVARQLFVPWLSAASESERRQALNGAAAIALSALGLAETASSAPTVDVSFQVLHGLYWLVANTAAHQPLMLAVDDAHWIDAPTLRFLTYLTSRIDELPMLLVVAARPVAAEDQPLLDALGHGHASYSIRLKPLSPRGSAAIVRRVLPEAGYALCETCHRLTGGNPLLLQELVRALRVEQPGDALAGVDRVDPTSVAHAALRRLSRLGPGAVAVGRAVAVLEQDASLPSVAELARVGLDEAEEIVESLVTAELLDGGRPLSFVHPIVRSAVYDALTPAVRARWHQRAARLLHAARAPAELVAAHLLATDPADDPGTVATLEQASAAALSQGAPDIALRYLRRALAEPPPEARKAALLYRLGLAEAHAHDPDATTHLAAAMAACKSRTERARMSVSLGDLLMIADHADHAVPVLRASLTELTDDDRELKLLLRAQLAIASGMRSGEPFSACRLSDLQPEQLPGCTLGERAILSLHAADLCFTGQPAVKAAALARRALAGDLNLGGMAPVAAPFIVATNVLMICDELQEAEAHWATALSQARRDGSLAGYINARALRPFSLLARGALAEAEADAQEALAFSGAHGVHAMWFYALAFLVEALVQRGKVSAVGELFERNELPHELPDEVPANLVLVRRGFASLAASNPSQALEDLLVGGERLTNRGITTPGVSAWRSHAALAHYRLGEETEAHRLVNEELALARRVGTPRPIGVALRTKGVLTGGEKGCSILAEAVDVLAASPARLEHAHALCELGAALRRSRRPRDARDPLRQALQYAHDCGADGLTERALVELRATGARPRRHAVRGADALTPAEQRICRFALDGLSNRQIAQELFITTRTVEVHLNHAFRKLDISSRHELAGALDRNPGEGPVERGGSGSPNAGVR